MLFLLLTLLQRQESTLRESGLDQNIPQCMQILILRFSVLLKETVYSKMTNHLSNSIAIRRR